MIDPAILISRSTAGRASWTTAGRHRRHRGLEAEIKKTLCSAGRRGLRKRGVTVRSWAGGVREFWDAEIAKLALAIRHYRRGLKRVDATR